MLQLFCGIIVVVAAFLLLPDAALPVKLWLAKEYITIPPPAAVDSKLAVTPILPPTVFCAVQISVGPVPDTPWGFTTECTQFKEGLLDKEDVANVVVPSSYPIVTTKSEFAVVLEMLCVTKVDPVNEADAIL
jgi:hypothetical protein